MFGSWDVFEPSLTFSMILPTKHIFRESIDKYENIESGVRIILAGTPTPISNLIVAPANTHAIVNVIQVRTIWKSNCLENYLDQLSPTLGISPQTYELCILSNLQEKIKKNCSCHLIAGDYFPRNGFVSTPKMCKECIYPNLMYASNMDDAYVRHLILRFFDEINIFMLFFHRKRVWEMSANANAYMNITRLLQLFIIWKASIIRRLEIFSPFNRKKRKCLYKRKLIYFKRMS